MAESAPPLHRQKYPEPMLNPFLGPEPVPGALESNGQELLTLKPDKEPEMMAARITFVHFLSFQNS